MNKSPVLWRGIMLLFIRWQHVKLLADVECQFMPHVIIFRSVVAECSCKRRPTLRAD